MDSFPPPLVPAPLRTAPDASRTKIIIAAASAFILLLLVVTIAGVIALGRKKTAPSASPSFGELAPASSASAEPSATPLVTTAPPAAATTPDPQQMRLSVSVRYRFQPAFALSVGGLSRSGAPFNTELFAPERSRPYSYVQVLDGSGKILAENAFAVPNTAVYDSIPSSQGGASPVRQGKLELIMPLPAGSVPVKVRLLSSGRLPYDEKSFTWDQLPYDSFGGAPAGLLINNQTGLFRVPEALANESDYFVIAVINEKGADDFLAPAVESVTGMVTALSPWNKHAGRIKIVSIPNDVELGCEAISIIGGSYPNCSDTGIIAAVVGSRVPDWNAIAVATSVPCNCGTVNYDGRMAPIAALGGASDLRLPAHEFGHSVGKLADEYMYQYNETGPAGPNCFASASACSAGIAGFSGAECSAGCNSDSTWRPSNRIMHNEYNPLDYGSLESHLIEQKILAVISDDPPVAPSPGISPSPAVSSSPLPPSPDPACTPCPVCPSLSPLPSPSPVVLPSPVTPSSSPDIVTPSPNPQTLTSCPNGGWLWKNKCWYVARGGESCGNACHRFGLDCSGPGGACQQRNFAMSALTKLLTGSDGTLDQCLFAARSLGITVDLNRMSENFPDGPGSPCSAYDPRGLGCAYTPVTRWLGRFGKCATSSSAAAPESNRICGCYQMQRGTSRWLPEDLSASAGSVAPASPCPSCACPDTGDDPNGSNLRVSLNLSGGLSQPATINGAVPTSRGVNVMYYLPPPNTPHWTLQILDGTSAVVDEKQIWVNEQSFADMATEGGTIQNALPDNLEVVTPRPQNVALPLSVRLLNSTGQTDHQQRVFAPGS